MPCPVAVTVGTGQEKSNVNVQSFGCDPLEILYQRRCANFIYVAPQGLRELMSDISREVIREHPQQLHRFIADYLHTLMVTRENAKIAMRFVEDVGDTGEMLADFIKNTNLTRHQIDKSARVIQRTFRRLVIKRKYANVIMVEATAIAKMMERLKVTLEEAHKAASIIQQAYHLYKMRQERRYRAQEDPDLHMRFRHIDWIIAAQKSYDIFKHTRGVRMSELHKAATLIQAAYRGYYTRKFIKDYWFLRKSEEVKLETDDECVKLKKDWAARVLQRFFRRIVQESKRRKSVRFVVCKQSSTSLIGAQQLQEMKQILIIDDEALIKYEAEAEICSVRAITSEDFEAMRDKAARIIQRFFRRIMAWKPRFNYEVTVIEHVKDIDSDMFEMDTEIENLFEGYEDA